MATNPYFNNNTFAGEQNLIESLIVESIKINGIDCYYIPRHVAEDPIFREDSLQSFTTAVSLECYVRDVQGFTGDGKFLSKFGLEIRDEMTFSISFRSFRQYVQPQTGHDRPFEGDLIYFPFNNKAFSVKFVDQEAVFYQLGKVYFWDVVCEVFEYSNEVFNTGVTAIDNQYNALSTVSQNYQLTTEDNQILTDEFGQPLLTEDSDAHQTDDQSEAFADLAANNVVDWSELSPFGEQPQN